MSTRQSATQPEQVQRGTFYILWCEGCGHATEPPKAFDPPMFVAPAREPMKCLDCGGFLLLVEGFIAPQTEMWQKAPGSQWKHVVYPEGLPRDRGRQIWMRP